VGTKVEIVL